MLSYSRTGFCERNPASRLLEMPQGEAVLWVQGDEPCCVVWLSSSAWLAWCLRWAAARNAARSGMTGWRRRKRAGRIACEASCGHYNEGALHAGCWCGCYDRVDRTGGRGPGARAGAFGRRWSARQPAVGSAQQDARGAGAGGGARQEVQGLGEEDPRRQGG